MPKKNVRTVKDIVLDIRNSFIQWKNIYFNGCADPSWEDGVNLNLVRSHCIYHRNELEKMCGDNMPMYPDEYYWPIPPEVPATYMAKSRLLACRGKVFEATEKPFEIKW